LDQGEEGRVTHDIWEAPNNMKLFDSAGGTGVETMAAPLLQ